jgi:site-specific DNA recombinase
MQIQSCKVFVQGQPCQIVKDEFFTAKDTRRPGLTRIIADLEAGSADWDCLIVYKLDRLTRSLLDGGAIFQLLRDNNKGFISVTENIDFSSPMGRAMLGIINIFAQLEREQLGERTRDKMISIASNGEYAPGLCPYGYRRAAPHSNILTIDPRKAETVRNIFKLYLEGKSVDAIHTEYKDIFSKNQITWILRNRHYIGKITYAGKEYPGKHEPIIDPDTFRRAQARLPNREYKSRPAAQKYPYILTGLVFCHCGLRLTPASAKNSRFHYYRCTSHLCKQSVSAPKLETAVLDFISKHEINKQDIEAVCAKIAKRKKEYQSGHAPELDQVSEAIRKTKVDIEKTADAYLSEKNKEYWDERLFILRQELARLELRRNELSAVSSLDLGIFESAKEIIGMLSKLKNALEADPENMELKKNLVTGMVKELRFSAKNEFKLLLNDGTTNSPEWLPRLGLVEPFLLKIK